jgi:hypothetical protein
MMGVMAVAGREWIDQLPAELQGQRAILGKLLSTCGQDERCRWLVVACSVGRGAGDQLSDLDMGMGVSDEDFDAALAAVRDAVDGLGDLVESYHHKIEGVTARHERIFAQYADRCQVDLVVVPVSEAWGAVRDEVVLYDPDGHRTVRFEQRPVTPEQVREWAFGGWCALADLGKYLRRGSAWEAYDRLQQARSQLWRLRATALGVPNPQFGLVSILDFAPEQMPADMTATVSRLAPHDLLSAAREVATLLTAAGGELAPEQRAALPAAMADYITEDLASLQAT